VAAKRLAAEVDARLACGGPAALSSEPLSIPQPRDRSGSGRQAKTRSEQEVPPVAAAAGGPPSPGSSPGQSSAFWRGARIVLIATDSAAKAIRSLFGSRLTKAGPLSGPSAGRQAAGRETSPPRALA
jgi:hypothetical protein